MSSEFSENSGSGYESDEVVEFQGLKLRQKNSDRFIKVADVKVKEVEEEEEKENNQGRVQLLQVSSKYGYVIVGYENTVVVIRSQDLNVLFYEGEEPIQLKDSSTRLHLDLGVSKVKLIKLLFDESHFAVVTDKNQVSIYNAATVFEKGFQPSTSYDYYEHNDTFITEYMTNPEYLKFSVTAMLFDNMELMLMNSTGQLLWAKNCVTAINWSKNGEYIGAAMEDGSLTILSINGEVVKVIKKPDELEGDWNIRNLLWLNSTTFVTVYLNLDDEAYEKFKVYVIVVVDGAIDYQDLGEVGFGMNSPPLKDIQFYLVSISGLDEDITQAVLLGSNLFPSIEVLKLEESDGTKVWKHVVLSDEFKANLPLHPITQEDLCPLGLSVDCSLPPQESIPNLISDLDDIPPVPLLYILDTDARISAYQCVSTKLAQEFRLSNLIHPVIPLHDLSSNQFIPQPKDILSVIQDQIDALSLKTVKQPILTDLTRFPFTLYDITKMSAVTPSFTDDESDEDTPPLTRIRSRHLEAILPDPELMFQPYQPTQMEDPEDYHQHREFGLRVATLDSRLSEFEKTNHTLNTRQSALSNKFDNIYSKLSRHEHQTLQLQGQSINLIQKVSQSRSNADSLRRDVGILPFATELATNDLKRIEEKCTGANIGVQVTLTRTLIALERHLHDLVTLINHFDSQPQTKDNLEWNEAITNLDQNVKLCYDQLRHIQRNLRAKLVPIYYPNTPSQYLLSNSIGYMASLTPFLSYLSSADALKAEEVKLEEIRKKLLQLGTHLNLTQFTE